VLEVRMGVVAVSGSGRIPVVACTAQSMELRICASQRRICASGHGERTMRTRSLTHGAQMSLNLVASRNEAMA
jgi:hypothetical protein